MSLGGFNLSTHKKDDTNMRSKVQDIKKAKYETRKLETEGKKMEERLMELRLAMNREKEERERHGGGFWKTGQQGTLNTYAEEVLAKKKSKSANSKVKIKVLKDKPLDLPERSNQPGTMAFIASRGAHTPRDRPKGPRCGQCEEKGAAVSCVQCAEDYCAGCFAAFHLKGNLKKHRSVPLTATPRQCFASPRPNPAQTSSSTDFGKGDGAVMAYEPSSARRKDRNSPEGASGTYENNLLYGSYNEAEQAASFQDALKAWRQGPSAEDDRRKSDSGRKSHTPRGIPYSPVQTPTVNMEAGTGTVETPRDIEISFNTSTMSYADRLLLKKHRRTDVDALFTPRDGSTSARKTPRPSSRPASRPKSRNFNRMGSNTSVKIEDFDENDFDDDERVDFRALYEAVQMTDDSSGVTQNMDTVSIVEVQGSVSDQAIEQSKIYKIQEEGSMEQWSTDATKRQKTKENFDVKPPSASKSSRRKSGKRGVRISTESPSQSQSLSLSSKNVNTRSQDLDTDHSYVLGAKLKDIQDEFKREKSKTDRYNVSPFPVSMEKSQVRNSMQTSNISDDNEKNEKNFQDSSMSRPQSTKSRPQSGKKSRPQTAKSRPTSRQSTRPASRTTSRIGSSRAASRIDNPGLLTKAPSESLQQIARMTPTSDPYKGMDSFFMVGVQPSEQEPEERTLTPTKHKDKEEKIKVSYQLYNMAPRSWKPDFSLADAVDTEVVETEEADVDRASSVMAYHAYSEQLVSDITERLISRFGELPLDEDSLSDHSSGGAYRSLGEEYRTLSRSHSSSLHNSPIVSGRGTPVSFRQTARESSQLAAQTPRKSHQDLPIKSARKSARGLGPHTHRQAQPVSRSQTPRLSSSTKKVVPTPRRSRTYHEPEERPVSRAVVMDGKDLSFYDDVGMSQKRDKEDEETLDQLEWELASQSGRLTAEGMISRMEIMDEPSDGDSLNDSMESFRSMSRLGQDKGYDINCKLRKEELEEDHDAMSDDEDNVRNLM